MTQWGKAGQRLTEREAAQRRRDHGKRRTMTRLARERDDTTARKNWAAGLMQPVRITHALGDREGAWVDEACGVREPTVDQWEAGTVYPTWEQVLALSALTGYTPRLLCDPMPPLLSSETSLRFHVPAKELEWSTRDMVTRFTAEAITRTLRAEGVMA